MAMWNRRIVVTVVLLAALVGCGGSTPTGDAGTTLPSTSPPSSVPQPPALTFTERERAPREFAERDALDCLRAEGLTQSGQPFDPAISGPAWRQCHTEIAAYLEVAPPSPEPVDTLMAVFDCMADQGFIDLLPSSGNDPQQYGQAQGYCRGDAPSGAGLLLCDAYRVGADGTIGTSPTHTDVEQLITVEATAPPTATVGTPFVVTIRPYTLTMPPTLYGFTVVDGSSFVRAFTVDGGSIDPASVRSTAPTDPDVAVSTESDGSTATFRYDSVVPATESIEFPEATFEVTPSAPGRVAITFSGYEQSITFAVDGDQRVVRIICTSRFGTPVAWSDAT
jgi:hypothetical protein